MQCFCDIAHYTMVMIVNIYYTQMIITFSALQKLFLRFFFYSVNFSKYRWNKLRILNKYDFHNNYLRTQDKLTITSAPAATISTQSDGKSDATSKPAPKHTADLTLCMWQFIVSPSNILYCKSNCVRKQVKFSSE